MKELLDLRFAISAHGTRGCDCLCAVLLAAGLASSLAAQAPKPPTSKLGDAWARDKTPRLIELDGQRVLLVPGQDWGAEVLEARREEQLEGAKEVRVRHDFRFLDRVEESGIRFVNSVVDDAAKNYKAVHYDHGNGVAAADVDGDGFYDLYFTSQLGSNELWRNRGDGAFENITEKAGVGVADRVSVAASFADTDNDGDPDLYVTTVRMGNLFFENDGHGGFVDRTAESGLGHVGHSSAAVFFDYNRDGLLDLFLTNVGSYTLDEKGPDGAWIGRRDAFNGHLHAERAEASLLFENLGENRFVDVSEERGLVDLGWSGDATAVDLDGDLFPDLYVLNMQGDDHFYQNVKGERFVDRTAELFPKTSWGAMGIKFFDYDDDGDLDLMVTDMHSDMAQDIPPQFERNKTNMVWADELLLGGANNIFGNSFYRNLGGGKFEEVSDAIHAENYWPWGVSVGDLNADGFEDVFITASMNYPFTYGINSVLLNEGGERFRHSEFVLGVEPRRDNRTRGPWFELDCSGGDCSHADCRGIEGEVVVYANLGSRSSVMLDLDGDGDLDVVTNDFNSQPMVLMSDLAGHPGVHWVAIRLRGRSSNRDGLGATVRVRAGGRVQTHVADGKSGYLSQSSLPLYFGLGGATSVDGIEVVWPSGARQTVTEGLGVDRVHELVEPSSP